MNDIDMTSVSSYWLVKCASLINDYWEWDKEEVVEELLNNFSNLPTDFVSPFYEELNSKLLIFKDDINRKKYILEHYIKRLTAKGSDHRKYSTENKLFWEQTDRIEQYDRARSVFLGLLFDKIYEYSNIYNVDLFELCKSLSVDLSSIIGKKTHKKISKEVSDYESLMEKVKSGARNVFCQTMDLSIPINFFKKFTQENGKNNMPYLTEGEFVLFIRKAFLGETDIEKQSFNMGRRERQLIQFKFYEFYDVHCFTYFNTSQCRNIFIELLTNNFTGWDFKSVKNNFSKRLKKKSHLT